MRYIAHRGASNKFIENTYDAFKYAFESSIDGCECDLRITRDHQFIVYHDENLLRLNHLNAKIKDMNLNEIKNLRYDNHQRIMTFRELLHMKKNYRKLLFIEVKDFLTFKELELLSHHLTKEDVTLIKIISFHLEVITYFKDVIDVMYLKDQLTLNDIKKLKTLKIKDVNLNVNNFNKKNHQRYLNEGLNISYWTVDDPAMQRILSEKEVQFLTTNMVE